MDPFNTKLRKLQESWEAMQELRLIGNVDDEGIFFVSYKELLVIFTEDGIPEESLEALNKIQEAIDNSFVEEDSPEATVSNIVTVRNDYGIKIYSGKFEDETIYFEIDSSNAMEIDVRHDETAHKIARALGASSISTEDYHGSVISSDPKRHVDFPDYALHGTSSFYLEKILSQGLRPPRGERSNYADTQVTHDKHIFLTTKAKKANEHAMNAVSKLGGFPIIFMFKIPDKKQIAPDYDVDSEFGATDYRDIRDRVGIKADPEKKARSLGRSRDVGVFGYLGAIPKQYIKRIYNGIVDPYGVDAPMSINDYQTMDVDQALENIKMVNDMGYDMKSFTDVFGIEDWRLDDPYVIQQYYDEFNQEDEDEEEEDY